METTKLNPKIWLKTTQDKVLKQIDYFEELQLFFNENKISGYFKVGSKIKLDGMIYSVKSIRFCIDTSENLSYDGTAYNLHIDVMLD